MVQAIDALGEAGDVIVPIFITVDPDRDTPELLSRYIPLFGERMIGLTGSADQVADAAGAYRVYYQKIVDESATEYLMDHSAFVYLMGRQGENLTVFSRGVGPERMAEVLADHVGG